MITPLTWSQTADFLTMNSNGIHSEALFQNTMTRANLEIIVPKLIIPKSNIRPRHLAPTVQTVGPLRSSLQC